MPRLTDLLVLQLRDPASLGWHESLHHTKGRKRCISRATSHAYFRCCNSIASCSMSSGVRISLLDPAEINASSLGDVQIAAMW